MASAFVGIGSNLGQRKDNLLRAVRLLDAPDCRVSSCSAIYESEAIIVPDQPDFLNLVAGVETELVPEQLLERCLQIEQTMGRVREVRYGPRIIDIDLLTYESVTLDTGRLTLPHPGLTSRAFVLVPLLEISPGVCLPDGPPLREFLTDDLSAEVRRVAPPPTSEGQVI